MAEEVAMIRTASPEETKRVASRLAQGLAHGDLIVLTGDLGAGKTCFTQGLGEGLGISAAITSPTFALHQVYEGRLRLNHLDVYRLDDLAETLDLDLPELLEDGLTVIEWGEQINPVLPDLHLTVRLLHDADDDESRTIRFETSDERLKNIVQRLAASPC